MASPTTPTTLNIGEPADEISVDGSSLPFAGSSLGDGNNDIYEGPKPVKDEYFNEFSNVSEQEIEDMIRYQFYRERLGLDEEGCTKGEEDADGDRVLPVDSITGIFPALQITLDDVMFKITPAIGAACHGYFSFAVMNPELFSRPFGASDGLVKNLLWLNAHIGAGMYIYSRKHVRRAPYPKGIVYSIFGSLLFNFSSLVVWGWGNNIMPNLPYLRLMFGVASSGAMLYLAQNYLTHVDKTSSELD